MNPNIHANQGSQASQGLDQAQAIQTKPHYEMREKGGVGALYIGGKKCEVTVGDKVITHPEQLRKLAKTFAKTMDNQTLEKGETLLLSGKGITKIDSTGAKRELQFKSG